MEAVNRATELLRKTEEKLRSLVSEATNVGDYASVLTIAAWARTVNQLTKSALRREPTAVTPTQSSQKLTGTTRAVTRNHSSRHSQNYPRFFRQGNQLVRIGWSKREKKEYRHKAPHSILKLLANAMAEKGKDGRVFSTEELLPLQESAEAGQVPNYQAYAGISFLKQIGLIDQHGRQGYSIPRMSEFKNAVEGIWEKLPEECYGDNP